MEKRSQRHLRRHKRHSPAAVTRSAGHSLLNTVSAAFPLRSTSSCRLRTAGPTHLPPLLLCPQLQHCRASPGPTPQPSHRRGRPSAGTAPLSPQTSSSRSPLTAQDPVGHSAHSGKRPRLGRPPAPLTARVSAESGTWAPQEEQPFGCCDHRRRGNGRITHPTAPLPLTAADARPYDRPPGADWPLPAPPLPLPSRSTSARKTSPTSPGLLSVGEARCQSRRPQRASQLPRPHQSPERRRGVFHEPLFSLAGPRRQSSSAASNGRSSRPVFPFGGRPCPAPFPSFFPSTLLGPPSCAAARPPAPGLRRRGCGGRRHSWRPPAEQKGAG